MPTAAASMAAVRGTAGLTGAIDMSVVRRSAPYR
jgi:hypothetical protein